MRKNDCAQIFLAKGDRGHTVHKGIMSQKVLADMQTLVVVVNQDSEQSEIEFNMYCCWIHKRSRDEECVIPKYADVALASNYEWRKTRLGAFSY